MLEEIVPRLKEAGPFAYLCLAGGAVGLVLAIITLALTAAKSSAVKVTSIFCLLCVLGILGAGFGGYQIGMIATMRTVPNVPDDMKDMLFSKGTEEARSNYTVALAAALLPLLAGVLAAVLSRFRVALVFSVLAAGAWGATLFQVTRPLPSTEPVLLAPAGLQLPRSTSPRGLSSTALVALTPEGLWAAGEKVASMAQALEHPKVRERNSGAVVLMADARVPFAKLADALDAAEAHDRSTFLLVVRSAAGENRVLHVIGEKAERKPEFGHVAQTLMLTLHVSFDRFTVGAAGGRLEPMTTAEQLNAKMGEIKTVFPNNETIRVTADPQVTTERLVSALDAVNLKDGKLLNDELVVGRFQLPEGEP